MTPRHAEARQALISQAIHALKIASYACTNPLKSWADAQFAEEIAQAQQLVQQASTIEAPAPAVVTEEINGPQ